jgi:hypothetical protein
VFDDVITVVLSKRSNVGAAQIAQLHDDNVVGHHGISYGWSAPM